MDTNIKSKFKEKSLLSLLPVEIICKIFEILNPLERLCVAASSHENYEVAQTAGSLQSVVILDLHHMTLHLHDDVASPAEIKTEKSGKYGNSYECYANLETTKKRSAILQTFSDLHNAPCAVTRVKIVLTVLKQKCEPSAMVILDPRISENVFNWIRVSSRQTEKVYDWISIDGSKRYAGDSDVYPFIPGDWPSLDNTFAFLTEALPARHLFMDNYLGTGDLIFKSAHHNTRSILESLGGVATNENVYKIFPRLRHYHNTSSIHDEEKANSHLAMLRDVREMIKEFGQSGEPFSFLTSVLIPKNNQDYTALIEDMSEWHKTATASKDGHLNSTFLKVLPNRTKLECTVSRHIDYTHTTIHIKGERLDQSNA